MITYFVNICYNTSSTNSFRKQYCKEFFYIRNYRQHANSSHYSFFCEQKSHRSFILFLRLMWQASESQKDHSQISSIWCHFCD